MTATLGSGPTSMPDRSDRSMQRRLLIVLGSLGLIGCASLLLAPFELLQPPELHYPALAFRALSLINPVILLLVFGGLGTWLAPRTGLDAPLIRAWLTGFPIAQIFRRQFMPALAVGAAVAVVLISFAAISAPWFANTIAARFDIPLLPRLLYGGATEEIICRWGLMTIFVWLFLKTRASGDFPYIAGATAAASLFALGHLPMLFLLVGTPSAVMIGAIILGNFVPGLLFGLLFWKRGLESAMMAHAIAHFLAWTVSVIA